VLLLQPARIPANIPPVLSLYRICIGRPPPPQPRGGQVVLARRSEPVTARTVRDNSAETAWRDVGWIHIVPAQPSMLSRPFGEVSEKPTCVDLTTRQRRRPSVVIVSWSAQDLFKDGSHVVDVTEKIRDVLRAGQQRRMSGDDDAIETALYHGEPAAKGFAKASIGPRLTLASRTKIIGQRPMEVKISNILW
jgi:hypothetical protein